MEHRNAADESQLILLKKKEREIPGLLYNSFYSGETLLWLSVQEYRNNGCMCIWLIDKEDGYPEPFGDMTVNLDGAVPPYHGYLDINNLPGIDKFVETNGIGEFTGITKVSGRVTYPLFKFHRERLMELCPSDMALYEEHIGGSKKE